METALYFPYMRVPQTPWFTQVLLYWDMAASIVPDSMWHEEGELYPYMHDLVTAGLLQRLSPDDGIRSIGRDDFDQTFLSLLKSHPLESSTPKFARIHSGKMSYSLFRELQRVGLAKTHETTGWEAWWRVEASTADMYMAYLAAAMSSASPGMFPVTDREVSVGTLAGTEGTLKQKLAALRYRVITEALPAPKGFVQVSELKNFKEENAERLQRCRRYLDDKIAYLATISDADLREVHIAYVMQEIEDDVAKLQEQMNKKKWPGVALVGFGGVTGAALATAVTLATGGSALIAGLAVGAGILELGIAGHATAELIKQPRFDQRAPLVYATLAGRLGGEHVQTSKPYVPITQR